MLLNKEVNVILAHPDDESFAFGGLIYRATKSGYRVILHTVTKGEKGSGIMGKKARAEAIARVRLLEQERAANILGCELRSYDFPDGKLSGYEDLRGEIKRIVSSSPNSIYATTFHKITSHPDHKAVCKYLQEAKPHNLLFQNRLDRYISPLNTGFILRLNTDEINTKKRALACHQSQQADINKYLSSFEPVEYFFCNKLTPTLSELIKKCSLESTV